MKTHNRDQSMLAAAGSPPPRHFPVAALTVGLGGMGASTIARLAVRSQGGAIRELVPSTVLNLIMPAPVAVSRKNAPLEGSVHPVVPRPPVAAMYVSPTISAEALVRLNPLYVAARVQVAVTALDSRVYLSTVALSADRSSVHSVSASWNTKLVVEPAGRERGWGWTQ